MHWTPGTDIVEVRVHIISVAENWNSAHAEVRGTFVDWTLTLRTNTIKAGELETVVSYNPPKVRDPKFNQNGDLLLTLRLEAKAIYVDDDFHLQVASSDVQIHKRWVKVSHVGDEADLVLMGNQEQG